MKKFAVAAAAALTAGVFGLAAIAQDSTTGGDFDKADANNDNLVSYEEALGVYATLTQDLFHQADANGDGNLDEGEFISLKGLTAGLDGVTDTPTPSSEASSSSSEASTSSSSEASSSSSSAM